MAVKVTEHWVDVEASLVPSALTVATERFSGPGVRGEARTAPELQYKDKVIVWLVLQ